MQSLQILGPPLVVVTSVIVSDTTPGQIDTFLLDGANTFIVTTPHLNSPAYGAGDMLSAAFLARLAAGEPSPTAISHAVSSVYCILKATGNQPDLALHAARDDLLSPAPVFPAVPRRLS